MSSVLQQIAQQFESIDPDKAKELRRIDTVYTDFGLNNGAATPANDPALRLLHYLPRMARMKNFRLYRIGVGEQTSGDYAHQAVALLEAGQLPTPGNTLAVFDPIGINESPPPTTLDSSHQYFFEVWQTLQHYYGHGCALISDHDPVSIRAGF
ncbi:MAG: hypothetical protein LAE24_01035 [Candidatus Contendobacter sp.]|nr:hypothetical protein [Candidatus Contendobacter sp.]